MKDAEEVAVFWDYENCPVPTNVSGYAAVNHIRSLAHPYGSVKVFRAYLGLSDHPILQNVKSQNTRSELQVSGVSLIDCPHNGRKEVADKMIIVDMLGYAMDNPAPTTIVLISGDRDFAYALSFLRLRRYRVILLTLPNAHISLTAQATVCLDWAVNDGLNASNTVEPAAATVQNKSLLLYAGNQKFPSADTQHTAQTAHIRQSANTENPFLIEQSMKVPRKDSIGKVPGNGFSLSPSVELSAAHRPSSANTSSGGSSKYLTPSVAPESYSSLTLSHTSTVSQSQGGFGHRVTSSTASDASEVITNPSETSYPKESTGSSLLNTCNQQTTIVVPTNNAAPLTAVSVVSHTIPKIFVVLVLYLQKLRGQGQYNPLRTHVAVAIAKGGETYRLAGVQKFSQYIAEAQKAGIVILGGSEGTAWIALSPSWYFARDA